MEGKISCTKEGEKVVVDFSRARRLKVLGGGRVGIAVRLILNKTAKISDAARRKIEYAGGEIVILE